MQTREEEKGSELSSVRRDYPRRLVLTISRQLRQ